MSLPAGGREGDDCFQLRCVPGLGPSFLSPRLGEEEDGEEEKGVGCFSPETTLPPKVSVGVSSCNTSFKPQILAFLGLDEKVWSKEQANREQRLGQEPFFLLSVGAGTPQAAPGSKLKDKQWGSTQNRAGEMFPAPNHLLMARSDPAQGAQAAWTLGMGWQNLSSLSSCDHFASRPLAFSQTITPFLLL